MPPLDPHAATSGLYKLWRKARHHFLMIVCFAPFVASALVSIVAIPFVYVYVRGDRARLARIARRATAFLFRIVLWYLRPLYIDVRLQRHAEEPAPLLIANHTSMFDIISLLGYYPDYCTYVHAKYLRVPILVPMIHACGFIPVDPSSSEQRASAYAQSLALLRAGGKLIVFPEGTRSRDGRIGPFAIGAFMLACEANVPVTPVFIHSSIPVFNKRGNWHETYAICRFTLTVMPAVTAPQDGTLALAARNFRGKLRAAYETWSMAVGHGLIKLEEPRGVDAPGHPGATRHAEALGPAG